MGDPRYDFEPNGLFNYTGDVMTIARYILLQQGPWTPEFDVDANGVLNYTGDVMIVAQACTYTCGTCLP